LVDFDGDDRLDLISGAHSGDPAAFHLFRRTRDGSWAPRQRLEVTPVDRVSTIQGGIFLTAADWNGDGAADLLVREGVANGILVAPGPFKENQPIALTHPIDYSPRGFVMDFAVADWDRDGKPDVLVRQVFLEKDNRHGIYWYRNLGGAGLPRLAEGKLLVEFASDLQVQGFCVGDWNGDGWPDLIVTRDVLTPETPDGKQDRRGTVWLYLRE
jgi:hypothetical protein